MSKKVLLIFLFVVAFISTGCVKIVDSYTTFSINVFNDFNELVSSIDKERYIRDGNLDFAKVGDVVIVPFIKETDHEECSLFVYAYSINGKRTVRVNSISLSTHNGIVLYSNNSAEQLIEMSSTTENMMSGVSRISVVEKTGEWFYSGNHLQLSFSITVSEGTNKIQKDLIYDIVLISHKAPVLPT